MKRELVGGPLLGKRSAKSSHHFDPLVTPLIGTSRNGAASKVKPEQFVLLPQERFIQVLSFATGRAVANLVPFGDGALTSRVESVCLATYPEKTRSAVDILDQLQNGNEEEGDSSKPAKKKRTELEGLVDHVVLVGCNDGTLREFSLLVLLASSFRPDQVASNNCGPWNLVGPCYSPRRTFKIASQSAGLRCLTAPACVLAQADYGLLAYVLVKNRKSEGKKEPENKDAASDSAASFTLTRILLPPFFDDAIVKGEGVIKLYKEGGGSRVQTIGKIPCEKLSTGLVSSPFLLQSVVRDSIQGSLAPTFGQFTQKNIFLVVAKPSAIHVFCERLSDVSLGLEFPNEKLRKRRFAPVLYSCKQLICSLAVSVNQNDIAIGHRNGDIVFLPDFLSSVETYHSELLKYERQVETATESKGNTSSASVEISMPEHPFKNLVESRVHWHALPVKSLCFDANSSLTDPILYSGGEESVLVSWQPSRGIDRPAEVLPRLARRGVAHITSTRRSLDGDKATSNDSILVFCDDNTLQLFETHNKMLLWKVQGLASASGISPRNPLSLSQAHDNPIVMVDPLTGGAPSPQLLLNGLPDAPGVVQWYDTIKQRVVSNLEIAPYNRISGINMAPMPSPSVTQLAASSSGKDLITIDKVPTENRFIGGVEINREMRGEEFGVITTVKFWSWSPSEGQQRSDSESKKSYQLAAAMVSPHGSRNQVSAIAMSSDGRFACTISNDEKAFRVWEKVSAEGVEGEDNKEQESSGRRLPNWTCRYKVATPSGYSNHKTGYNAIAFSSDASVIAIAYGHMLTLWDRENMALLTSIHHFDEEDIDSVEFIKTDTLLCKSQSGVSVQSPFKSPDLVNASWYWTVLDKLASVYISSAQYIPNHDVVAISVYYGPVNTSRIVLINATTGKPMKEGPGVIVEHVPGIVCSISAPRNEKLRSNWRDTTADTEEKPNPLALFALTSEGKLVFLSDGDESSSKPLVQFGVADASMRNAPRLPSSISAQPSPAQKRRRVGSRTDSPHQREKQLAMVNFGNSTDEDNAVPLPISDLPLLGGGFARAFVGRNLSRKKRSASE